MRRDEIGDAAVRSVQRVARCVERLEPIQAREGTCRTRVRYQELPAVRDGEWVNIVDIRGRGIGWRDITAAAGDRGVWFVEG